MNIFDQYGIKEVADVTLYSIHKKKDGSGEVYYVPALYLDTLKVSTTEKTADNVWAEGGKGNARLINWDYGKTINVSLEDALCTPASLGLCWNGTLSADWEDAQLNYNTEVCYCKNPLNRISRMEKGIYPRQNTDRETISSLLPKLEEDQIDLDLLKRSSVIDGTDIRGFGIVTGHTYGWKIDIETGVLSIAVIPDRFFDIRGRSYPIDQARKVSVANLPTYSNYKDAIIYKINSQTKEKPHAQIIYDQTDAFNSSTEQVPDTLNTDGEIVSSEFYQNLAMTNLFTVKVINNINDDSIDNTDDDSIDNDKQIVIVGPPNSANYNTIEEVPVGKEICEAQYLAIIVDNNDDYFALIGVEEEFTSDELSEETETRVVWYRPRIPVNVYQFKGIDMWLKFESINALSYFLITKYNEDIRSIVPESLDCQDSDSTDCAVDKDVTTATNDTSENGRKNTGSLWAYVNPRTMQPYPDDYWFHQGEPYYIKSLTIAQKDKRIKGNKITVRADQWPGMYMMVGETYIRERETGEDERMQIKFPLCKVRSEHNITLQADGDPTTFNLELEVAKPSNGVMMELTSYEVADKLLEGENGCFYAVDGSTIVLSE